MYHKLFFDFRVGAMNAEQFKKDVLDLGMSESKFNQCQEEEKYKEKIKDHMAESLVASAYGSPTIFINQKIFPGAYPFEDFANKDGDIQKGVKSIINGCLNPIDEN